MDVTARLDMQHGAAGQDVRCECGQLIAKFQQDGIELKCKRIVTISFASIEGWTVPSPSVGSPNKKPSNTAP